jgi:hypothetical protein
MWRRPLLMTHRTSQLGVELTTSPDPLGPPVEPIVSADPRECERDERVGKRTPLVKPVQASGVSSCVWLEGCALGAVTPSVTAEAL